MKYIIGFILGVLVTGLLGWRASDHLMMDGSIQSSFNSLVAYGAIENGLKEDKILEVRAFVENLVKYEERYIIENKKYAWFPRTQAIVDEVAAKQNEIE